MAKLITVYWRDIPAQVIGRGGGTRVRRELAPRFAEAIDTAALRAGRGGSEAYLADWRRHAQPCQGDLQAAVEAEAERLERTFDAAALRRLARAGGIDAP